MSAFNAMQELFEEVTILGKPALFTSVRIARDTIPPGYHRYEVRHDDDCTGIVVELAYGIMVNHWGTLITRDKIELIDDGRLYIGPGNLNYGAGDCRTMEEFAEKYPVH